MPPQSTGPKPTLMGVATQPAAMARRRPKGRDIQEVEAGLPLQYRAGSASPEAYERRVRQEKYRDIPTTREEKIEQSHRLLFGEDARVSARHPKAEAEARAAYREKYGTNPELPPLDFDPRATPDEIAMAYRPKGWDYGQDISLGSVMRSTAAKKKKK